MARIFISHSAKDEFAKKVRQRLTAKLEGMGLDPLVDEDLIAGDAWRAKLHLWLGCCEGAIILFSRDALERSEWVKKEATILSWRKSLHPGLLLVPVRLGDVSEDELTRGYFASLELGEIQAVCCKPEEEEALDRLVDQVARPFLGLPRDHHESGFGDWVRQVARRLRLAAHHGLEQASAELGIEERDWRDFCDQPSALAHHLLHIGLEPQVMKALANVWYWMDSQEIKEGLLRWVWFLWVREEAARQILVVNERAEGERLLAINASRQETGYCYIRRATCGRNIAFIISTSGVTGEDPVGETLKAFERALRKMGASEEDSGAPGSLSTFQKPAVARIFFVLMKNQIQRGVIDALRQRFPLATLVLLSGPSFPESSDLGLRELVVIEPALEAMEEATAMNRVAELQGFAGVEGHEWKRRQP